MEDIIKLALVKDPWVLLVGVITCILIGAIKTPIRKVVFKSLEKDEKREMIFDIVVFLGSFVMAFLGAMVYYLIASGAFVLSGILSLSSYVWLAQSMAYGIWKKLGLKRLLLLLVKLVIKDRNGDGKITLDEAVAMVRNAFKNGKLDVDELLKDSIENISDNIEAVLNEATKDLEPTKEELLVKMAVEGNSCPLVDDIKGKVETLVKPEINPSEDIEVAKPVHVIGL